MRLLLFSFLTVLCFPAVVGAQIIDPTTSSVYEETNYFNPSFLSDNGIKEIIGRVSTKKNMRPITNQGLIHRFVFSPSGHLVEETKTFRVVRGVIDTTENSFAYNDLDQLIRQSTTQSSGYTTREYRYNKRGQAVEEVVYRGKNEANTKYALEKGEATKIKEESYSYDTLSENQIRKVFLNNMGKAYMETVVTRNAIDQITERSTLYYITNKRKTTRYNYDENGYLTRVETSSNLLGNGNMHATYTYDELGNVTQELTYKDGKLYQTRKFLYFPESLRLKAELRKEESSGTIRIIEFDYMFFDKNPSMIGNNQDSLR